MMQEYQIFVNDVEYKDLKGDLYVGSILEGDWFETPQDVLEQRAIMLIPELKDKKFEIVVGEPISLLAEKNLRTDKLYISIYKTNYDMEYKPYDSLIYALDHPHIELVNNANKSYTEFESWEKYRNYLITEYDPHVIFPVKYPGGSAFGLQLQEEIPNKHMVGFMLMTKEFASANLISQYEAKIIIEEALEEYSYYLAGEAYKVVAYDLLKLYKHNEIEPILEEVILGYDNALAFVEELNDALPESLKFEPNELKDD